jgi:hypothetical protein
MTVKIVVGVSRHPIPPAINQRRPFWGVFHFCMPTRDTQRVQQNLIVF